MHNLTIFNNEPFQILAYGLHCCKPDWNKGADAIDLCYKLYFVKSGSAQINLLDGKSVSLCAGNVYFIPGRYLHSQQCEKEMEVYWIHFVPSSPFLARMLSGLTEVIEWSEQKLSYWQSTWEGLGTLSNTTPWGEQGRVQALLMLAVSEVITHLEGTHLRLPDQDLLELTPAIAFLDKHFKRNPPLEEIAETVFLTPNYFHRKFTKAYGETPMRYILNKRLQLVRQLLISTDWSLEKIAKESGFSTGLYLSRVFKKEFGYSPIWLRKNFSP